MHSWSTDDIAEPDRFAVWREWRAAQLFGVRVDLDRAERRTFRASITSRDVGGATIAELRSSAYRVSRSWQDIAQVQADSVCIYQQLDGPQWAVRDDRRERLVVPRSHISIGYSDLPYETLPMTQDVFHTRLVKIPATALSDPHGRRMRMAPRVLRPEPGICALLASFARSFFENMTSLTGEAAEAAIDTLGRLAILAEGDSPVVAIEGGKAAVAAGQLAVVQDFVCRNLRAANLSPEWVAAAFRISPRQVHRLFEPTGTTFARYVLQHRVAMAAERLVRDPEASILDTAFGCGFNGSSAFYRAFKTQYGATPSEYRTSMQRPSTGD